MLTALKLIFKMVSIPILFLAGFGVMVISIVKEAKWALFLLILMIPQANLWYMFHEYPIGKDFNDLLFVSALLGMIIQRKGFIKNGNSIIIMAFILIGYFDLWNSSTRFGLPLPIWDDSELLIRFKNYAQMIFLYFLGINILKEEKDQQTAVVLMAIVVLFIAIRSYRNFSGGAAFDYSKRYGGPFEAVLLGANHFGAFIVYYCATFLGIALIDKEKKRRLLFLTTVLIGIHPLFFAYSRGAYLAALGVLIFLGLIKMRIFLILVMAILIFWHSMLPVSVVDRISMTETEEGQLETSAGSRITLWNQAMDIFRENPIFGVGYQGFGYMVPADQALTDTHNFYVKTLAEGGIIGILFLVIVYYRSFRSGWLLYRHGKSTFLQGTGLGFMGCIIAIAIANIFGDRFSYFVLGGYYWILWGIVDRGLTMAKEERD